MKQSEGALELAVAKNEALSKYCGWAVIAGLVVEVFLAFAYPKNNWLDTWGTITADVFVALGVWGEILFSGRSTRASEALRQHANDRLATAEKEVADANVRAAEANRAAEELRTAASWRRIPDDQCHVLRESLRSSSGKSVKIWHCAQDLESWNFAEDLRAAFAAAWWHVEKGEFVFFGNITFGVSVYINSPANAPPVYDRDLHFQVAKMLEDVGIPVANMSKPAGARFEEPETTSPVPQVQVYIGPKPFPSRS